MLVNVVKSYMCSRQHTPVGDDDAPRAVINPVYCGVRPSVLRRIYTESEGTGEGDQICVIEQN